MKSPLLWSCFHTYRGHCNKTVEVMYVTLVTCNIRYADYLTAWNQKQNEYEWWNYTEKWKKWKSHIFPTHQHWHSFVFGFHAVIWSACPLGCITILETVVFTNLGQYPIFFHWVIHRFWNTNYNRRKYVSVNSTTWPNSD